MAVWTTQRNRGNGPSEPVSQVNSPDWHSTVSTSTDQSICRGLLDDDRPSETFPSMDLPTGHLPIHCPMIY